MKIANHRLQRPDGTPYRFVSTPNVSSGALTAKYLVMHFTAGSSASESINWLANPAAKASAHIVIDKAGNITQMVPFNKVAWHAGQSQWRGINGLNRHSIGIELDNPGRLTKGKDGKWRAAFGTVYPESEVIVATHKNESTPSGWYRYPQAQLDAALELAKLLVSAYGLVEVIGHEDISPGRKQDPGPAFPMRDFAAAAMSGTGSVASPATAAAQTPAAPPPPEPADGATHATTTTLKVRSGPGSQFGEVAAALPEGTRVTVLESSGDWRHARIPLRGVDGWMHGNYLRALPGAPAVPAAQPAGDGSTHATTARLKIRRGPGQENGEVAAPLEEGTGVAVLESRGDWRRVRVPSRGVEGWVHGGFLKPVVPVVRVVSAAEMAASG